MTEITYFGNDDGVLAQVCADAELDIEAALCTENAIGSAYAAAGVPQEYFGSELNEIELLALAASGGFACPLDIPYRAYAEFGSAVAFPNQIGVRHVGYTVEEGPYGLAATEFPDHAMDHTCGFAQMPAGENLRVFQVEITMPNFVGDLVLGDGIGISIGALVIGAPGEVMLPDYPDGVPYDVSTVTSIRARFGHMGDKLEITSSHPDNDTVLEIEAGDYEAGIVLGVYINAAGQIGLIVKTQTDETDLGYLDTRYAGKARLMVGMTGNVSISEGTVSGDVSEKLNLLASEMVPMEWPGPARDWKNQAVE